MPKQYGGPGPRLIHPSMAWSLSLSRCDPMAQLLWDRMILAADDQGRMIADPEVVRAQCVPLVKVATSAKVAVWLNQLEAQVDDDGNGMILRYDAAGHPLLQIWNWWDSQNGMRRAYPSRWPAPDGWQDRVFGLPSSSGNGAGPPPAERGQGARTLPAQTPHGAGNVPAGKRQDAGKVPSAPRARTGAGGEPNLTEGTYVPRTELSPYPLPGDGDMLAGYRKFLAVLSESTGVAWREGKLSRDVYLDRRREGFEADDLESAARGVALDPWFMGQNSDGVPHFDPATVLKSPKLQTFIGLDEGTIVPRPVAASANGKLSRLDAEAAAADARVAELMGGSEPGQPLALRALPGGLR